MLLSLAAVLVASCKKTVDPDLPSISWASNAQFAQVELTEDLDGAININAPGKIQSFTMAFSLGSYGLLANPYISISANKAGSGKSPVFDIIDDASTAAFLSGLGMSAGTSLRGKTTGTVNLVSILNKLIEGQPVENNTTFSIDMKLTDEAGNSVTRVARFHFTSGPTITWPDNPDFTIVDLNGTAMPNKVKVNAPGHFEAFTITIEYGAAPELVSYIRNRTTGSSMTIDLINDEKVAESFKDYFPAGSVLAGKTDAVLDFGFLYANKYDYSASTNVFTVVVTDRNGKKATAQLKFKK